MTQRIAIVPMRGGSVRIPGKNLRHLNGKPLFCHIIERLQAARTIERVVVDSDSDAILDQVRAIHPDVLCIKRPPQLGEGATPMNDVIRHVLMHVPGERFLQTHATNPFLRPHTIDAAVEELDRSNGHDSLFSVTAQRKRFYDTRGKPLNHDPARLIPTQDLEPLLEENSCIYLFSRQSFNETGHRIGRHPLLFQMNPLEAVDIDTEEDWTIAEALASVRGDF